MRRRLRKEKEEKPGEEPPVCDSRGNLLQRCLVCFEQMNEDTVRGLLPCEHSQFCHKCIGKWADVTNKCPLCGNRFNSLIQMTTWEDGTTTLGTSTKVADKTQEDQLDPEFLSMLEEVKCKLCQEDSNEGELLLCDNCDQGYHSSCLGMSDLPGLEFWYCDECMVQMDYSVQKEQWEEMERLGRRRHRAREELGDLQEGQMKKRRRLRKHTS